MIYFYFWLKFFGVTSNIFSLNHPNSNSGRKLWLLNFNTSETLTPYVICSVTKHLRTHMFIGSFQENFRIINETPCIYLQNFCIRIMPMFSSLWWYNIGRTSRTESSPYGAGSPVAGPILWSIQLHVSWKKKNNCIKRPGKVEKQNN